MALGDTGFYQSMRWGADIHRTACKTWMDTADGDNALLWIFNHTQRGNDDIGLYEIRHTVFIDRSATI